LQPDAGARPRCRDPRCARGRRRERGGERAAYVAFDLMRLNGQDIRLQPLEDRRKALSRLVASVENILFSEAFAAEGALVFAKPCQMGLEGIASTRQRSHVDASKATNELCDLDHSASAMFMLRLCRRLRKQRVTTQSRVYHRAALGL
jgi:ATP-dependent DNA ligase